jgi:hypothetical protein
MATIHRPKSRNEFEFAIICALPVEHDAVETPFDMDYEADGPSYGKAVGDRNAYMIGKLGNQHVVLAYMPGTGCVTAAAVAANIPSSFRRIKIGRGDEPASTGTPGYAEFCFLFGFPFAQAEAV